MKKHYICILTTILLSGSMSAIGSVNEKTNGGWKLPEAKLPDMVQTLGSACEDQPSISAVPQMPVMHGLPRRIAESKDMLIGYNTKETRGKEIGMYRLNTNGAADFMYSTEYDDDGYDYDLGWLRNGYLCGLTRLQFFDIADYKYLVMNPTSGEIISEKTISLKNPETGLDNYLPLYISCAYDPTDDTLWGYTVSEKGSGYTFFTAPADDVQNTMPVVENEQWERVCASICYNEKEKALYGINRENNFVRIERDGSQTLVMKLGVRTEYARAALLYDAEDDCYLWNAMLSDYGGSFLYCIDPKNKVVSMITDFDDSLIMPFMGIVSLSSDPAPISKPIIDKVDFGKGQTNGTITFFMPDSYFSGEKLSGEMDWTAYLNDAVYKTGKGMAGDRISVEYNDISEGVHEFSFVVEQNGVSSTRVVKQVFIGYDKPKVPQNVKMDDTTVSWDPITRGVNGGYMDIANLTYHVYINNEEVGSVVGDTSFVYSSDTDRPYAGYVASVVAENNGHFSDMSEKSDIFTYGKPWDMDVHFTPTNIDLMAFSAFDVNQDKNVWSYVNLHGETPTIREPISSSSGCDDWLFTPPLNFDDDATSYEIALDVANTAKYYNNLDLKVYLCNELNPYKQVELLIDYTPGDTEFHRVSQVFSVPEPGVYYIAFYSKREAYKSGIFIKEIDIKKTNIVAPIPSAVTDVKAEGAPLAELKANVEFTMPTTYVNGDNLPEDLIVDVLIECPSGDKHIQGHPGEKINTIIDAVQGNNDLKFTSYIDDVKGKSTIATVYCGYGVPGPVNVSAYVSEDNLSMTLNWTPPSNVGDNGHYVDPSKVNYVVMLNTEEGWVEYETLDSNTFEYTFTVKGNCGLKSEWIGIAPSNVAGRATTYAWMSDMMGTPYSLPVVETLKGGKPEYSPIRIIRSYDPQSVTVWDAVNPAAVIGDDTFPVAMSGQTTEAPATGCLMLPKFSTKGVENAGMKLGVWTGRNMADITVFGETFGVSELIEVAKIPAGTGWAEIEIPFPKVMQDRQWISIFLVANYKKTTDCILVSGYSVDGGFSAVESIGDSNSTSISGGDMIRISGFEGQTVRIFTLDGRLVKTISKAAAYEEVEVESGFYIVTANGKSVKVIAY